MAPAKVKQETEPASPVNWRCDVAGNWDRSFAVWRWLLRGGVIIAVLAALCGFGLTWLGLPILAFLAYPYRFVVELLPRGLSIRWLFLKRTIRFRELGLCSLEPDSRIGYIGRRPLVLVIHLSGNKCLVVRAPATVLRELAETLSERGTEKGAAPAVLAAEARG